MAGASHLQLLRGAEVFATKQGLEIVDPAYFWTERRWKQIQEVWAREKDEKRSQVGLKKSEYYGTVGAVALDKHGNLAAATSTGGMTNKRQGRVGDSPIIGAGTYAKNGVCAISATGHGEYFIRAVAAYHIASAVEYRKLSLEAAARELIHTRIPELGGNGGIIAIGARGEIVMDFNTDGMFRAARDSAGRREVAIERT